MTIKPDYALYFYNLTTLRLPATNYAPYVTDLKITTTAPGGFGTLDCTLKVHDARIVPLELAAFSNVAMLAGPQAAADGSGAVFLGRLSEPGIALKQTDGTTYEIHCEGWSANLTDDPTDLSYSGKTAQQIVSDQFTQRANTLIIDSDQSAVLPDNPAAVFTASYNGDNFESTLNAVMQQLGDYLWTVYEHTTHKDAAGFPKAQLYFHTRNTTTINYQAFDEDIEESEIKPATDIAYNVVQLAFRDSTQNPPVPASVTVKDSRLAANGSQGTAPFPWRKYRQDLGDLQLTPTQITTAANQYLNQYKNIGYRSTVKLSRVRNAQGIPIPLWQVRSDSNIFLPQLNPIGTTLATGLVTNQNVFYIYETNYDETSGSTPTLTITCGDTKRESPYLFEVLKRLNDAQNKRRKAAIIQQTGAPEYGYCSIEAPSIATAGTVWGVGVNFKRTMTSAPTSITLTAIATNNFNTIAVNNISTEGFTLEMTTLAGGAAAWRGTYRTNGN